MESERLSPNADHSPTIEKYYSKHDDIEHYLSAQLESFLNRPERPDAHQLSGNTNKKEVVQLQSIVGHNTVLERRYNRDRGV
jgi:hypothetical protein